MSRRKRYIPPSLPAIGKVVNKVFDRYGQENPIYYDPEIRLGLIRFLAVVGAILAKHLSTTDETTDLVDNLKKWDTLGARETSVPKCCEHPGTCRAH